MERWRWRICSFDPEETFPMSFSPILDHPSTGPHRLRLLTHNIYGIEAGWDRRREVLVAGLHALAPDIVTLRETIVDATRDQPADLLGADYQIVHSKVRYEANGLGISIGSRWPIVNVRELDLKVVSARTEQFPARR